MKDLFQDPISGYERGLPEWQKKIRGQEVAAITKGECIRRAREIAKEYAIRNGTVSIDEVREGLICSGFDLSDKHSKNWMGSIFKGGDFEPCGFKRSEHAGSHSRIIQVWKLSNNSIKPRN